MLIARSLLFVFSVVFVNSASAFELHKDFSSAHGHALRLSLDFNQPPQVMVESVVDLKLIDRDTDQLVDFLAVQVEASMYDEGMDHLPIPVNSVKVGDGHFRISNLYFIMGGGWQLEVKLSLDDHSYQLISIPLEFDPTSRICRTPPSN